MGKKTAVRRRTYRRYYRRYRSVSNRYFPCRVEGVFTIGFPSDPAGAPRFYDAETKHTLYLEQKKSGTVVVGKKIGRNDLCPCGSGKKYKKCCMLKEQ